MSDSQNIKSSTRRFPHGLYIGYGILLACSPATSVTEIAISIDFLGKGIYGWFDQIAFVLCFVLGFAILNVFKKHFKGILSNRPIMLACLFTTEAGFILYGLAGSGFMVDGFTIVGSALKGLGYSGLVLGWLQLFVDGPTSNRSYSAALPAALLIAAILGIAIWLLAGFVRSELLFVLLGALPIISFVLMNRIQHTYTVQDIQHQHSPNEVNMPWSTRLIIFVFGLALGCIWAIFYSQQAQNLSMLVSLSFLALGIIAAIGSVSFFQTRELKFGSFLRLSMLLVFLGFLVLPIFAIPSPAAVVVLLALGWAAQILLLFIMPVQIATQLPVNMISVASKGGIAYGIGAVVGSAVAGIIFISVGATASAYSMITALVGLSFAVAVLYFPNRKSDASVLGMKTQPENELHTEMIVRRSHEVAQKWGLTSREEEIMKLMVLGKTRGQIAGELVISTETVKTHNKNIYTKLSVHSLRELVTLIEGD